MHRQVKGYFDLAFEYHISALTLWTQIMEAPYLYNPIRFLLRHTIELQLKGLIVIELRKDNKQLVLRDIRIGTRFMNNIHSLLILWEHYNQLLKSHNIILNTHDRNFINKAIKKADKKDSSSTKYRYPVDKEDKALNLLPVDIQLDDKAPDLGFGVPFIIQCDNNVGILNKGQRLMQDVIDLFDVVELLFELMENPK